MAPFKVGEEVSWHESPSEIRRGRLVEVPAKYEGRWASVEYSEDGFTFATLIETVRLSACSPIGPRPCPPPE